MSQCVPITREWVADTLHIRPALLEILIETPGSATRLIHEERMGICYLQEELWSSVVEATAYGYHGA